MNLFTALVEALEASTEGIQESIFLDGFVFKTTGLSDTACEFEQTYCDYRKQLHKLIKKENEKYIQDGFEEPIKIIEFPIAQIYKADNFDLVKKTQDTIIETGNDFANRVGEALLKQIGCKDTDIHITQDANDDGIDYWGKVNVYLASNINLPITILGQVKRYELSSITVGHAREFIGACESFRKLDKVDIDNGYIFKQYVTSGDITSNAMEVFRVNGVNVITKRHLVDMKFLRER